MAAAKLICCSRFLFLLILHSKIIQIRFKAILGGEAGVHEESLFVIPFFEATVVKQFQIIFDDKWHNVML